MPFSGMHETRTLSNGASWALPFCTSLNSLELPLQRVHLTHHVELPLEQDGPLAAQVSEDMQQLFGLAADDELMEAFDCAMVQEYSCNHNSFSTSTEVGLAAPQLVNASVLIPL